MINIDKRGGFGPEPHQAVCRACDSEVSFATEDGKAFAGGDERGLQIDCPVCAWPIMKRIPRAT